MGGLMVTSFIGPMHALLPLVLPTLQLATANQRLHQKLLDSHRQVLVSLLWGHRSFLLDSGAHKFLFVPSCALHRTISQSCVSSDSSIVGLITTSSKRAYAIPKSVSRAPVPVAVHC